MIQIAKPVIKVGAVTVAVISVVLFRKSLKRIYEATVKPAIKSTCEAFKKGL